jgi:hypothetical protein
MFSQALTTFSHCMSEIQRPITPHKITNLSNNNNIIRVQFQSNNNHSKTTNKFSSMASTNKDEITLSSSPIFISTENLRTILTHQTLINHIQSNLPKVSTFLQTPIRQHYNLSPSSSLLLMPSWSSTPSFPYIGVKLVTHFPENSSQNLPGVQGSYVLFNSTTGQTLASMDSTELTLYRTSCVSGLASKYLSI